MDGKAPRLYFGISLISLKHVTETTFQVLTLTLRSIRLKETEGVLAKSEVTHKIEETWLLCSPCFLFRLIHLSRSTGRHAAHLARSEHAVTLIANRTFSFGHK